MAKGFRAFLGREHEHLHAAERWFRFPFVSDSVCMFHSWTHAKSNICGRSRISLRR